MTTLSKQLTPEELKQLRKCEAIIEVGRRQFKETLGALSKIHDGKLYRQDYKSFEDYCQSKWGFGASRARQYLLSAETVENLKSVTIVTPENEAQTRELTGLTPDEQRKVWTETVKTKGTSPTARDIAEVRDRVIPPTPEPTETKIISSGLKRMNVQKLLDRVTNSICEVEAHFPGEIELLIADLETHLERLKSINPSNVLPMQKASAV